jgi:cytochrome c-type biogenesis protein
MATEQLFMSTVFIAGLLSFFAPCILPLLPVYVSTLSADLAGNESRTFTIGRLVLHPMLILKTFIFVTGLSTAFILLGFGAGALGNLIYNVWFFRVIGLVVVLLGIHQTGLIHLSFLEREKKVRLKASSGNSLISTYLLGLTFSFGWTPCIGPVLGAVLGVAASEGQAAYGGWLMFIYSLGLMIPFMLLALFSDLLLGRLRKLNKHMNKIKIAGGIIIILMGLVLLTNNLNTITVFIENLF